MAYSVDELRQLYPHLGFGLYALTPGSRVTLEVYDGAKFYSFEGLTAEAAINAAFPPPEPETPHEIEVVPDENVFD